MYLIILFNKFQHNGFFIEKNKVIVAYDLDLDFQNEKFRLVSSVTLQGDGQEKIFQSNLFHIDKFYEIEDLLVNPIIDQSVIQKEPYILIYKKFNS